jgi:hypothetical protein
MKDAVLDLRRLRGAMPALGQLLEQEDKELVVHEERLRAVRSIPHFAYRLPSRHQHRAV